MRVLGGCPGSGGATVIATVSTSGTHTLRKLAIVPAYNEQDMVARVVRDIYRHAPDFDVVVVDDGSLDGTAAAAEAEGAVVLRQPFNLGIGGAMQAGYKYALHRSYDLAVQVDGDGQHKPEYLPEMVDALHTSGTEADMVYGSRFLGDPGYKVPFMRKLGNRIFGVVLSAICRQSITDPTSGFRMVNRNGIELFARDYPHDYPEVEAILMLHAHRLKIHEVHVKMNARGFGESSIDYMSAAYYMVKVMLAIFIGLLRRRPVPNAGDLPQPGEFAGVAPGAASAGASASSREGEGR
jgi:glycosyltransferase involved in cell wall biosynthesis